MNFTNFGGNRSRFGLNSGALFDNPGRGVSPKLSFRARRNGLEKKARAADPIEALNSLVETRNWLEAVALLQDLPTLAFLWQHVSGSVKRAWDAIESASSHCMSDCYRKHFTKPDAGLLGLFELAELFAETEHPSEAASIFDALIRHHTKARNHGDLVSSLDWRARLHWQAAEFDGALTMLKMEERACREHADVTGLAQVLNNQALLLEDLCEIEKAQALYQESENLLRKTDDHDGLAMNLCNQARLLADRTQTQEALEMLEEVERLGAKSGNHEAWARSLLLTSALLADLGRPCEAHASATRGLALAAGIHHKPLMNALEAFLSEVG